MIKIIFLLSCTILLSLNTNAQDFEMNGSEIGFDVSFSSSTLGGNVGLGLKYGLNFGENLILGPSARYERTWVKNQTTGLNGSYNVYGGGVFVHGRFFNVLFAGVEYEILKSPFAVNGLLSVSNSWAHTLFLGGGFSKEFNESIRINAGIYYDLINAENSPFRRSYSVSQKNELGQVVKIYPIIFRLAFFIPLS